MRDRFLTSLILIALCACGNDQPAARGIHVDSIPTLQLFETLRIGSATDPEMGFTSIRAVTATDDGKVYLFESAAREIRVYSSDGRVLHRIGRAGNGPGEFAGADVSFGVTGDTVWTISSTFDKSTLAYFRVNGELISTAPVDRVNIPGHAPGSTIAVIPRRRDSTGLFVGERSFTSFNGPANAPADSVADTIWVPKIRFDSRGKIVDTAGSYPIVNHVREMHVVSAGSGKYQVPPRPYDTPFTINNIEGSAVIERVVASSAGSGSGAIHVTRIAPNGDTLFRRTIHYDPVPLPASVLDSVAAAEARQDGRFSLFSPAGVTTLDRNAADSLIAFRVIRAAMDWPAFRVPASDYHVGEDGAIWVLYRGRAASERLWLLIDPSGNVKGKFAPPEKTTVYWSKGEELWAVQRDSLDVPFMLRFELRSR